MVRALRRRSALLAATLVAACNGAAGAPSPSAAPGSFPVLQNATPAPVASAAVAGSVSISSILGTSGTAPASTAWTRVSDPGAAFTYEAPSTWTGHGAYPWQEGGQAIGTVLASGPDLTKLVTDFSVPGVAIGLSANPGGLTAHDVVAADDYAGSCGAAEIHDSTVSGASASFRLWEHCAGGAGYLLVVAIVPADGKGLIGIIFQGATQADLGFLDHIVGSIRGAMATATAPPAATPASPVAGQKFAISMDICQNQHGQGVAEGLIRNDDTLVHTFRIVVAFSDPNGVLLNDTWGTTPDVPPGITAKWQAVVPSGLPAVSVSCRVTKVELVN